MVYDTDQCTKLLEELTATQIELDELLDLSLRAGELIENTEAKVYIREGLGRRIVILKHCLASIYRQFPPSTLVPLTQDQRQDVQIALHAFVMNLYGAFENLAWAFVIRHDLMSKFQPINKVGVFSKLLQKLMPVPIASYLTSDTFSAWSKSYLKNYRDSLAHRIPLYIPPAEFSSEHANRYAELDELDAASLQAHDWDGLQKNQTERDSLGRPSFMFLTSLMNKHGVSPKPMLLHPQLLSDANTLIEFSKVFLKHWHEVRIGQRL
jgi:hypothetical protein